jgi:uncharacterized delta-60 repeat protein
VRLRTSLLGALALAVTAPLVTPAAAGAAAVAPFDPSWGVDGISTPFIPGSVQEVHGAVAHPDGGVVLAVSSYGLAQYDFVVLKFGANGAFDTAFGDDGMLTVDVANNSSDEARAVAVQPDGKIVVAGTSAVSVNATRRFGVVRLLADGRLDPTFSGDGKLVTSFGGTHAFLRSVLVQADGRIVAAGGQGYVQAARYQPNGLLDRTFDIDGRVMFELPGDEPSVEGATVDADGRVLVTGFLGLPDTGWDHLVGRLTVDGALDPTFGVGGWVFDDGGFGDDGGEAIMVQPDGRILSAGWSVQDNTVVARVLRHLPDGSLDPAFGVGGRALVDPELRPGSDQALGVGVLADGRIVVTGSTRTDEQRDVFAAVLTADGALDPTFDNVDGAVVTPFGPAGTQNRGGRLALQPDGRIVVAGTYGPQAHLGVSVGMARFVNTAIVTRG